MPRLSEKELGLILARGDVKIAGEHSATTKMRKSTTARRAGRSAWKSEHAFQAAVVDEAGLLSIDCPLAGLLYAVPNGQYRRGQRMEAGLRKGVPDLCLPVARRGYHGLYIELKIAGGRLSEAQQGWLSVLGEQGYLCRVIVESLDEARSLLRWYLNPDEFCNL